MVVNTINPRTLKTKAVRSLNSRIMWSTNKVSGLSSLVSEENRKKKRKLINSVCVGGGMFQPQKATDFGTFNCIVMVLESMIEERGYAISL